MTARLSSNRRPLGVSAPSRLIRRAWVSTTRAPTSWDNPRSRASRHGFGVPNRLAPNPGTCRVVTTHFPSSKFQRISTGGNRIPSAKPNPEITTRIHIKENPTLSRSRVRTTAEVGSMRSGHLAAMAVAAMRPATSARENRGDRNSQLMSFISGLFDPRSRYSVGHPSQMSAGVGAAGAARPTRWMTKAAPQHLGEFAAGWRGRCGSSRGRSSFP